MSGTARDAQALERDHRSAAEHLKNTTKELQLLQAEVSSTRAQLKYEYMLDGELKGGVGRDPSL